MAEELKQLPADIDFSALTVNQKLNLLEQGYALPTVEAKAPPVPENQAFICDKL